jgi:hypothetical protein
VTCCGMLPSGSQAGCIDGANANDQAACSAELGVYDDAGLCH